jgi:tRNA A-37 threonylcarbamoyl transferase component Bud32
MNSAEKPVEVRLQPDTTGSHRLEGPWLTVARVVSMVLIGLSMLTFAAAVLVQAGNLITMGLEDLMMMRHQETGMPHSVKGAFNLGVDIVTALVFFGAAVTLFLRKSDNWMVMLTAVMLSTFGGNVINSTIFILGDAYPALNPLIIFLGCVGYATFIHFLYTFPDGRFVPRWIAPLVVIGIGWVLVVAMLPISFGEEAGSYGWIEFAGTLAVYLGSLVVQLVRGKHYGVTEKQQVKWITFGLGMALIGFVVWTLPPLVFPGLNDSTMYGMAYVFVSRLIMLGMLSMVPITIGLSMMRFRLWDIDFMINRSLVYGVVTGVLVVLFILDIFLFQRLFLAIAGADQAPFALAVAAMVSGVTFQPTRRWLQTLVDKNIYGIQVDYRKSGPRGRQPQPAQIITGGYSGTQLGVYQVMEPIGRGGMAEIYKGHHPTLDRTVAIKVLAAERAEEEDFRVRFEREARTVAALRHPNIVQMFDFGVVEGTYYMVMEHIDGGNLSSHIRQNQGLPLDETIALIDGIAKALDYAHEQGIVHRDVKPSNVMLQRETTGDLARAGGIRPVLMDFGIAKMVGGVTAITRTGVVGTLDYIAPEQIRDSKDVDGRVDVYSLGVMTYEMLTGRVPFQGSNPGAVLIAHLQQPPPDPREFRSDISLGTAQAIMRAMEKQTELRYATAGEFAGALAGEIMSV